MKTLLHVEWSMPHLPEYIGPFSTRDQAAAWAEHHIKNGEWETLRLNTPEEAWPS